MPLRQRLIRRWSRRLLKRFDAQSEPLIAFAVRVAQILVVAVFVGWALTTLGADIGWLTLMVAVAVFIAVLVGLTTGPRGAGSRTLTTGRDETPTSVVQPQLATTRADAGNVLTMSYVVAGVAGVAVGGGIVGVGAGGSPGPAQYRPPSRRRATHLS